MFAREIVLLYDDVICACCILAQATGPREWAVSDGNWAMGKYLNRHIHLETLEKILVWLFVAR